MVAGLNFLIARLQALIADRSGASAIEYALVAGIVVLGLVALVPDLRESVVELFNEIGDAIDGASDNGNGG